MQQGYLFESVMTEQSIEFLSKASGRFGQPGQPAKQTHSGPFAPNRSNRQQLDNWLAYLQTAAQNSYLQTDHTSAPAYPWLEMQKRAGTADGFVLMRSPALSVLLTATPIQNEGHPQAITECQVGLTFSEQVIAAFLNRQSDHTTCLQPNLQTNSSEQPLPSSNLPHPRQPTEQAAASTSSQERQMTQKSFVLNWAKQLAISHKDDSQLSQIKAKQQLQQTLLLDQVIARIRHSLDLSEILETTVTQAREFLLADRLVVYQFDPANSAEPLLDHHSTEDTEASTVWASRFASDTVRQSTPRGYVTYESRASTNISSVLHFSEEHCFNPSQALRAQYLIGQPVAVDDVEQQYAGIDCLLNFLREAQIKSKIIVPIVVQDQLWGLLIAHQCRHHRHWEEREAVFLQHVAEHLAVAIRQTSLYQQLRQQTVKLESCVIERTQSLHDALVAAETASATKGEFLSTMSHELRTPLTHIIGMSATLLRWSFGELTERQRSYLNTIHQSGEQLLDIINNILEFADVESGRSLLNLGELSLSQLVDTVSRQYYKASEKREIAFFSDFKVPSDSDMFRADTNRLQQILSNLLHNAVKFTPVGGQVTLRVWRESQAVIFQVEDTGIGIPESQKDILFETFKQLESPFQRQYSGTGLGLAMTKRLVELHNGSIQVDSQVGKGSTFTVRLPAQTTLAIPSRAQVPALPEDTAKRIVLLETDADSGAIICETLTAAGYEVVRLSEPSQLVAKLEMLRPGMLIADLSLIGFDRDKLIAIQLSIAALGIKVLALVPKKAAASSSVAHHDLLRKPILSKTLLRKVRQLMITAP